MAVYQKGPYENITIQDALTIIAVYAGQIDPQDCKKDINRIEVIAESRSEFVEKKENIFRRINTYANSMPAMDQQKALEIASDALNPELKKTAFELAVEVALQDKDLTVEKKAILYDIATTLSIDRKFAQQTFDKFTK